jgi:hypothetical protein
MNTELLLKLQSWVDGELPDRESRQMAELVRTDKEAAALAAELKTTKGFLAGNGLEAKLPESREFYWSKIERAIERAGVDTEEREPGSWLVALRRLLVPATGFALVAFLTVASLGVFNRDRGEGSLASDDPIRYLVQEENLSKDVDIVSYKSKSENMFVVYVTNRDKAADDADMDMDEDDTVIQ